MTIFPFDAWLKLAIPKLHAVMQRYDCDFVLMLRPRKQLGETKIHYITNLNEDEVAAVFHDQAPRLVQRKTTLQ